MFEQDESTYYYPNSWVDTVIPEITSDVSELIYQRSLSPEMIQSFLKENEESDIGGSLWSSKGELNFPGPFYTAETDTCGTGIIESPNNVIFNENFQEFVMIQPRIKSELYQLWLAADVEVFGSYYCDGNDHWTVQEVKYWWLNRTFILECLTNKELIENNCNQEKRYRFYIQDFAEEDLKKYCFFLDNGYYPTDEALPELTS